MLVAHAFLACFFFLLPIYLCVYIYTYIYVCICIYVCVYGLCVYADSAGSIKQDADVFNANKNNNKNNDRSSDEA